ncbi:MAG: rhomboid family intramembrane serine protease [Bacteroidales bacterium]|nr:rhomboid family intramembrane serine protease [Bacteroidales bacterium]
MKKSLVTAMSIVSLLWVIFIIDLIIPVNFTSFGILPRSSEGIKGILFAPFLHLNLAHIMSNTMPLLILLTGLFWFYERIAWRVLALSIIIGNGLVWILGRSLVHVGASGVIFSLVSFFILSAVFKKNLKSLILGLFVFFMYGGIIWGVLPGQAGISWEGHLFGFIAGGILAYFFRDVEV